jgi:hypothetical protein
MTNTFTPRHCAVCGALESDLATELVLDHDSGDVVHVRAGLYRCGVMVLADEVTP